jgi:hypothetical protein
VPRQRPGEIAIDRIGKRKETKEDDQHTNEYAQQPVAQLDEMGDERLFLLRLSLL